MSLRNALHPINEKTCCPPGKLTICGSNNNIVVASMMRSGTHVMINLILNNFPDYKNSPLYINLDFYIANGMRMQDLSASRNYVVKTHFPQCVECQGRENIFHEYLNNSVIVLVKRDPKQVEKSLLNFGEWGKKEALELKEKIALFDDYWGKQKNCLIVDYDEIIDPGKLSSVIQKIAEHAGCNAPSKIMPLRSKSNKFFILCDKLLTRVLGRHAPNIDTGIKIGK